MEKQLVVCVSPYEQKYYFEENFKDIPKAIQEDLLESVAKISEKVNAIIAVGFYPSGQIYIEQTNKEDVFVDEIGTALEIKRFQQEQKELIKSLQLWYVTYRTEDGKILRDIVMMQTQRKTEAQIIEALTEKYGESAKAFIELMLED